MLLSYVKPIYWEGLFAVVHVLLTTTKDERKEAGKLRDYIERVIVGGEKPTESDSEIVRKAEVRHGGRMKRG